ncbi:MAG: hypothetical protein ACRDF8_10165 [Chloroflexota bacterium]
MPLKISDLAKSRRELALDYEVEPSHIETLNLTYTTSWLTAAKEAEMREMATAGGRNAESLARVLSDMLVDWDVIGEKGKPYPTNFEHLAVLSIEFLAFVLAGINQDLRPNPQTGGSSAGG